MPEDYASTLALIISIVASACILALMLGLTWEGLQWISTLVG